LPALNVDTHNYGLLQLVDFIDEHYLWGSKQHLTLWRELDSESFEIKSDQELLEWFQVNLEKGIAEIVGQIDDFEGPLQCSPTKYRCHPSFRNRAPTSEAATNMRGTSEAATNVRSTSEAATIKRAKKTSKKKRATYDSVGVDEEGIYSDTYSLVAPSDSSYDTDLATSSDSGDNCSDPEFDPDSEIVDDDDDDEFDPPPFSYDADDPCIDVDVAFPDVDQCKSAVTHHAILNDHAFEIVKKDKCRFRAICKRADKGCQWKFFASTSKKYLGCKVKTSGPKHTCGSVNN